MSGWEFKHPIKRGSHWEELDSRLPDDRGTMGAEWIAQEEARAQKQADEHRARGGYVGGV
jgi:hypothetical protein